MPEYHNGWRGPETVAAPPLEAGRIDCIGSAVTLIRPNIIPSLCKPRLIHAESHSHSDAQYCTFSCVSVHTLCRHDPPRLEAQEHPRKRCMSSYLCVLGDGSPPLLCVYCPIWRCRGMLPECPIGGAPEEGGTGVLKRKTRALPKWKARGCPRGRHRGAPEDGTGDAQVEGRGEA